MRLGPTAARDLLSAGFPFWVSKGRQCTAKLQPFGIIMSPTDFSIDPHQRDKLMHPVSHPWQNLRLQLRPAPRIYAHLPPG